MRKSAGFGALLRNIAIAVGAVLVATLLAGALIWFDVVDTVAALLLALMALGGFFLFQRQLEISAELASLRQHTSGLAEFEADINRRLDNVAQAGASKQKAGTAALQNSETLARKLSVLEERVSAVERSAGAAFENIPAQSALETPDAGADGTRQTIMKPAALSRINLKAAINKDGLSLHLQPIVGLPDRRPIHFEALMRLKLKNGDFLDAHQFLKVAEKGELMPSIDKKVLFSSVRMLRTLEILKKKAGLFCNLSIDTLNDARSFREILNFLEGNVALNQSLVFEVSQRHHRHLNLRARERLNKMVELGFALSLDQVMDLRLDIEALRNSGFRFAKVPAAILLHAHLDDQAPAPPTEFAQTLSGQGLQLIATEVEKEEDVMNLLDFGVNAAQGNVFAPPRPVKPELLQGLESRSGSMTAA